jgi:hypothetical protein
MLLASTRKRSSRRFGAGYGGSATAVVLRVPRPTKMWTHDTPMLARKNDDVNHSVAMRK